MKADRNRHHRRHEACRRRAAFSLAEVVITLLLLGILAAIAGPAIADTLSKYRVMAAAERIVADASYARRHAKSTSAKKAIKFDPSTDSYVLIGVQDLERRAAVYTIKLDMEPYRAKLLSADFDEGWTVEFDGYGVASPGGEVVVGCGSFEKTVKIDSETGEATIQ